MNVYHRGMVTLACIPTAVFYFLPLAIGKFNELYPNIKVRILEQGTNIAWNRCCVTNQTLA
ncbi:transcriptional regulator [Escherichia coli]|uniref:Transcriptional regulator n=1 Tax=Escherichia coli TaxID=562 RepID=A0A485JL98_ECOLX|nr:transcriptional regulator [Escherichia coli]